MLKRSTPNSNYPIDHNPKSKKAKWVFGLTISTLSIIGLTLPVVLTNTNVVKQQPIADDEIMYEIKIGNIIHQITYGDFAKRANDYVYREQQQLIDLTNSFNAAIITSLYEQEHQGYLKFKAVIEQKNRDLNLKNPTISADQYGYDVTKSAATIKKEQRENLQNAKRGFQSSLGAGWEEKWISELKTNPIYGFQDLNEQSGKDLEQIEAKAITYMTTQVLKQPALARFESAKINLDQWSRQDLSWEPKDDISYQDDQGQWQKITKAAAKQMMMTMLDLKANARFSLQSEQPLKTLAVFETKSYLPEARKPNAWLKTFTNNFFQSAIVSSFDLPIKMGQTNLRGFNFDAKLINDLFKINEQPINNLIGANQFAAILQLSHFQGATMTNQSAIQQARDQQLLTNLTNSANDQPDQGENPQLLQVQANEDQVPSSDPVKTLGSSQWQLNSTLLAYQDEDQKQRQTNLLALGMEQSQILNPQAGLFKAKNDNPFNVFIDLLLTIKQVNDQPDFQNLDQLAIFWDQIKGSGASQTLVQFVNLIKNSFVVGANQSGLTAVKPTILATYNEDLTNLTNQFSESDLAFLAKLLRIAFIDPNVRLNNIPGQGIVSFEDPTINDYDKAVGFWTLYQLSEQTFLNVGEQAMTIFSIQSVSGDQIDQMVLSDLERTLNVDLKENLLYNVEQFYQNLNQEFLINQILLNNDQVINLFKYQLINDYLNDVNVGDFDEKGQFMNQLNDEQKTLINQAVQRFQTHNENNLAIWDSENLAKGGEKISDWLITTIEKYRYYDFSVVADEQNRHAIYWQYDPANPKLTISDLDLQYWGITNIQSAFMNRYLNLLKIKHS